MRWVAWRRALSASSHTTTLLSGTRATTSITRDVGMAAGTASAARDDEPPSPYGNTSTRVASCSTRQVRRIAGAERRATSTTSSTTCMRREFDGGRLSRSPMTPPEYYLGAYAYNEDAGTTANGSSTTRSASETRSPVSAWAFGEGTRPESGTTARFVPRDKRDLPASTYPQFDSWASVEIHRPGGPFSPYTGARYAYSQIADI